MEYYDSGSLPFLIRIGSPVPTIRQCKSCDRIIQDILPFRLLRWGHPPFLSCSRIQSHQLLCDTLMVSFLMRRMDLCICLELEVANAFFKTHLTFFSIFFEFVQCIVIWLSIRKIISVQYQPDIKQSAQILPMIQPIYYEKIKFQFAFHSSFQSWNVLELSLNTLTNIQASCNPRWYQHLYQYHTI